MTQTHHARPISILVSIFFLTLLLVTISCTREGPQDQAIALKTDVDETTLISQLESGIPPLMEKAMIPGLSVAVVRDGALMWTKDFGVKSRDTGAPVTEETIFEAASFSKPVFAFAVMKLVERGALDLDKPLLEYVSDESIEKNFLKGKIEDDRFRKITGRMVLSHSCGFPNWRRGKPLSIDFEPGEKFSYSGEGFGFLQKVVEEITGSPLVDFMKAEVFGPLNMESSGYVWREDYEDRTSYPHDTMGKARQKRKPKQAHAAATLHTTAADYAKFIMAIMNQTGIQASTVDAMLTPQVIVDPDDTQDVAWGLGIGLEETPFGRAYWHWGDNMTFRCFFIAIPAHKIGVVYFTNSFFGLTIRRQIVELAIGGEHPVLTSRILANYGDADSSQIEFTRILVHEGVDAAVAKYHQMRASLSANDIVEEGSINSIGYVYMQKKQYVDAIKLFMLNVDAYPDSSNVYDSLGEAYAENGDIESAILNYEKSLELNPDNKAGAEKLEKLRETLNE